MKCLMTVDFVTCGQSQAKLYHLFLVVALS